MTPESEINKENLITIAIQEDRPELITKCPDFKKEKLIKDENYDICVLQMALPSEYKCSEYGHLKCFEGGCKFHTIENDRDESIKFIKEWLMQTNKIDTQAPYCF